MTGGVAWFELWLWVWGGVAIVASTKPEPHQLPVVFVLWPILIPLAVLGAAGSALRRAAVTLRQWGQQ